MIVNNPTGENIEIKSTELVSIIKWNKDEVLVLVKQYAEKFVGLMVTEDNLKDMEDTNKELSSKLRRLEEFRKEKKAAMEGPIKQFDADVKEVAALIESVKTPIAEQIRKFEDQRRCEQDSLVNGWILSAVTAAGLREKFSSQISIAESWTNRTAQKAKVIAEIDAKIATLMQMQKAEDDAIEMKRQRDEMAEMMCKVQSKAAGLAKAITPTDIYGLANIPLAELPATITNAVTKRKESETAAVAQAEKLRLAAEDRKKDFEAKQAQKKIDDDAKLEAGKLKQAEIDASKEAIRRVESAADIPFEVAPEPQYKMTMKYFGTMKECDWLKDMLAGNGIDVVVEGMELQ